MSNTKQVLFAALMLSTALGGCGLFVPEKDIFSDDTPDAYGITSGGGFDATIYGNVECELRTALYSLMTDGPQQVRERNQWLASPNSKWGVSVTLKIAILEQSALNPGVSLNTPFPNSVRTFPLAAPFQGINPSVNGANAAVIPQFFSLGLGLSGSANAQRVEIVAATFSVKQLVKKEEDQIKENNKKTDCSTTENGIMIKSDLKIPQFLRDKMQIGASGNTNAPDKVAALTAFQDEITFVAAYGGRITPTWTFARFSADPSSALANGAPLLGATRTSTNDLIVTFGQLANSNPKPGEALALAQQPAALNSAAQIGSAVGLFGH